MTYTKIKEFINGYLIDWYFYKNDSGDYLIYSIIFFSYTWIAIKFQVNLYTSVYYNIRFSFSLIKPNLQIGIDFQRNTA